MKLPIKYLFFNIFTFNFFNNRNINRKVKVDSAKNNKLI